MQSDRLQGGDSGPPVRWVYYFPNRLKLQVVNQFLTFLLLQFSEMFILKPSIHDATLQILLTHVEP